MKRVMCGLVPIALLLAGCGGPESECRDGIADMSKRVSNMLASSELRDAVPPVQAQLDAAQARLADGDYDGCIEGVKRARAALNASQRNN